mgnify:CR=1 FL=1
MLDHQEVIAPSLFSNYKIGQFGDLDVEDQVMVVMSEKKA